MRDFLPMKALLLFLLLSCHVHVKKLYAIVPDSIIQDKIEQANSLKLNILTEKQALSLFDQALQLLDKQAKKDERIALKINVFKSNLFLQWGKPDIILEKLNNLLTLADELKDNVSLVELLIIKSRVYLHCGFKHETNDLLLEALKRAETIQNNDIRHFLLGHLHALLTYTHPSTKQQIKHFKEAYLHLLKINSSNELYRASTIYGNTCYAKAMLLQQDTDSAALYLERSWKHTQKDYPIIEDYFTIITYADLHIAMCNMDAEEEWLLKLIEHPITQDYILPRLVAHERLYYILLKQNKVKESHQYLNTHITAREEIIALQAKYTEYIEKDIQQSRNKYIKKINFQSICLTVLLVTLIALLISWLSRYVLKFPKKKDIDLKENANPNIATEDYLKETTAANNGPTSEQINELRELAKNADSSFMIKFYNYLPHFEQKLNTLAEPHLNSAELEICAYSKLNFSTKEIAFYRKDSVRSVENRKYRIRKKLNLDSDVDFILWMVKIKSTPSDIAFNKF